MKKAVSVLLSLLIITSIAFMALPRSSAQTYMVELLWSNPMGVNDIAVSKDSDYIAVANNTGFHYFSSNSPDPMWWVHPGDIVPLSVAISGDGEYIAVGFEGGRIIYRNESRTRAGEQGPPTWMSTDLGGPIERGTLDMSVDGKYVVAGGTGPEVYYFAGSTERSGFDEVPTWRSGDLMVFDIHAVDMSSDGKFVAAGGENTSGFVVFYKDADQLSGPDRAPNWNAWSEIEATISDLAVSDDGYSVVAVDLTEPPDTLHYWADATTLTGDPSATWTNPWAFHRVDMSSDGDKVIAGTAPEFPCGLHFWANANERTEGTEDWTKLEGKVVLDVAISDDGNIIAASTMEIFSSQYKAHFYTSNGNLIGEFELESYSDIVSMSGDGGIVAVGGSLEDETLNVFRIARPVGGEALPIDVEVLLATSLYAFAASYWWILALLIAAAFIAVFVKKKR